MADAPIADSYDVIVVGGGVIGSSVAYHLAANPDFAGTVAVIERDPSYATASSSLSTSSIRQQFGSAANIRLSSYSIEFLRRVDEHLGVDGYPADIGLREPGYLILGLPGQEAEFEDKVATQRDCGVNTELLSPAEIGRRFPWLRVDDIAIGSYGPEKEGWFDGPALLQAFRRKARALGATYVADTVTAIDLGGSGASAGVTITLASGRRLSAGTVVNAAGAWSGALARLAGIALPVVPSKHCVFVVDSPEKQPDAPFIFDPSGAFVRPEGRFYLCGFTPRADSAPDDFSLEVDHTLFDDWGWPALAHRIPGFEQLRLLRAWAGLYEHNQFDSSAVIGRHPDAPHFVFACGFSGHGMMHSPAAGAGVAELITYGAARSVDLDPFAYERIAQGRPIPEKVY